MSINERLLYRLIGERIRSARLRMTPPMTQAQLAMNIGLSRASVVNIEAGRQHPPIHLLWQIADALGTEINRLIPNSSEYGGRNTPTAIDERLAAQIEAGAAGDPDTLQTLTEFVKRATTRG